MARVVIVPILLAGLATVLVERAAFAQPILEPNYLEFNASPDHSVTSDGAALVARYDLRLYVAGSDTVQRSINLGKPVPKASGVIRLPLRSLLAPLPTDGRSYQVRVAAVGPGGVASSTPSLPFAFARSLPGAPTNNPPTAPQPPARPPSPAPCAPAISPAVQAVSRAGGKVTIAVTEPSGCKWTAYEGSSWLSIASGTTGTGNGIVTVIVARYTGRGRRAATATIAGRTVSFSQSALPPAAPTGFRVVPR